jgi:hypothetical protein
MIDLQRSLDIILEDEPVVAAGHPLDSAITLVHELHTARQRILDIQHELEKIKHRLSADLALAIRRAKPSLSISLDRQGCKIGYKTKHLQFIPDVEQEMWRVVSPNRRFLREFLNKHRRVTFLATDVSPLVQAIISYFDSYYRTLGEDCSGTGILLIENRRATLLELASSRDGPQQRPLLSRRMRHG